MSFFIQDAIAATVPSVTPEAATQAATTTTQAAHAAGGEGFMSMIWMLVAFFAIFYFLLIRPQSKRAKEQRKLIESLAKGDEVATAAGMLGKIVKVEDDFVVLNLTDNVDVTFQKGAITTVLPKGTLKAV
jgi:preprotein translocase subunit YajC